MGDVIVKLDCGHYVKRRVEPRAMWDEENCPFDGWQPWVEIIKKKWHSRCTECSYHRRHGMSKKYAEESAQRHWLRTGHRVNVQFYAEGEPPDELVIEENKWVQQTIGLPPY